MPDAKPIRDLVEIENEAQREILYALTSPEDNQPLWSLEDLAREMEDPNIIDSIKALQRSGLVNRTSEGYVFATRAAVRQIQIIGRVG
jgi:hypothetical protein